METPTKSPAAKKIERIAFISFGVLLVFIATIVFFVKMKDREFLNKGIRTEAIVNGLYESGTSKNKSHTMVISMFTKEVDKKTIKSDTTGKSDSQKKMDAIIDGLTINTNIGNYLRLTINCNSDSYNKYRSGDKIKVVYLKEDSTDVRILSELE